MIPKGILKRSFGSVLLCDLELLRREARYRFRTFCVIRHVCTQFLILLNSTTALMGGTDCNFRVISELECQEEHRAEATD